MSFNTRFEIMIAAKVGLLTADNQMKSALVRTMIASKCFPAAAGFVLAMSVILTADIISWQTGRPIPGTEGISLGPGVILDGLDLQFAQLSHQSLINASLVNVNLASARLINAVLTNANLAGANLENAVVTGADLSAVTRHGFASDQLYRTANYQVMQDFWEVDLSNNDLSGWEFDGQDLVDVNFTNSALAGTSFSGANLKNVRGFEPVESTITRNATWPDGTIRGLRIEPDETVVIHQDRGSLGESTVSDAMTVSDDGKLVLQVRLEPVFGETRSRNKLVVLPGTQIDLGGTLQYREEYPPDYRHRLGIGEAVDLFDWPEPVTADNRFAEVLLPAGRKWDTSDLYTTGEITLIETGEIGDFDVSGVFDLADINSLTAAVRIAKEHSVPVELETFGLTPSNHESIDLSYDVDSDWQLNQEDRRFWVERLAGTHFGDADLDRVFNSTDLVTVFQLAEYDDGIAGNSLWQSGDWDGDGDFTTSDLVLAFESGGYKVENHVGLQSLPEPDATPLLMLATSVLAMVRFRHAPRYTAMKHSITLRQIQGDRK